MDIREAERAVMDYCRSNGIRVTEGVRRNWARQWVEVAGDCVALERLNGEHRLEGRAGCWR